jgi:hypothetical protein
MMETRSGLTFREVLLALLGVVVVLAAAQGFIPEFGRCCPPRTLEQQLCSNLQTLRSQIELYKIQHNDKLPGTTEGVSFVEALMLRTDANGLIVREGGFGPYLQQFPMNERNGLVTVEIDGYLGGGDYGWHYDTKTGGFHADTDEDTEF